MADSAFSSLPDDILLNIFFKLEDDPRYWARLACVSTKFSSIIRNICWKNKCSKAIPSLVADLAIGGSIPPGGWASLHKLAVCCPGLIHSGVLLENSDFGLGRELGPDENYMKLVASHLSETETKSKSSTALFEVNSDLSASASASDCAWSLYDDLYLDTVYNDSEASDVPDPQIGVTKVEKGVFMADREFYLSERRRISRSMKSHLASGVWNLSREEGNKLLRSRFRGDSLYICDWPGCVHIEEKRNYMIFRGVFKNFKGSHVWRTIRDGNRNKIDVNCAFCSCNETWDLHSAFCLRRVFGYHDDGEPVVRAYVCENGHVSGAWTDLPLYT
ncbi:phytochrome A-associated F-box protein-like [Cucurbita pepo subsp. pepo]|uniref:phytochrome A-associated F-box protein-like n=1 Tax=Cucurbita pepo subsp. pepo TaxID=3664 RepID=UPI000C9D461D|nr:phytochrome A-associated F-box protein-like [Cucurbita pepo subsp. pepo]